MKSCLAITRIWKVTFQSVFLVKVVLFYEHREDRHVSSNLLKTPNAIAGYLFKENLKKTGEKRRP